eukprot:1524588-Alexandrium_andersonii.AAC.1
MVHPLVAAETQSQSPCRAGTQLRGTAPTAPRTPGRVGKQDWGLQTKSRNANARSPQGRNLVCFCPGPGLKVASEACAMLDVGRGPWRVGGP